MSKEDLRLYEDFRYYALCCLSVQKMRGGALTRFRLNGIQVLLEEVIKDIKRRGLPVRLVILKARREGVSTWVAGRFYWKTATNFNRYALLIAHEPQSSRFLFNVTKRFQRYMAQRYRPYELYNNRNMLVLNHKERVGLDSCISVGSAVKSDFGSGQLIHDLHLSEVAKWPQRTVVELLTSLLQCVPDELDTEVIFESTAKGVGGEFYDRFWAARHVYEFYINKTGKPDMYYRVNEYAPTENVYSSVFIPWFIFEKYQMDLPMGFYRTEEENALVVRYKLTDKQIQWRRWAIANRCLGDWNIFRQEYPANPQEAFVSANCSVFCTELLLKIRDGLKPPMKRYECNLIDGTWKEQIDGRLLVWEEVKGSGHYLIAADVAEGVEGGDFSSADVIEHRTGVQVAHWHGRMDADMFGVLLMQLGFRYNRAWLIPERNNHGLMVVTKIATAGYPRLYAEMVVEPPSKSRQRFGWLTTRSSKTLVIDNLIAEVREGAHGIRCAATVDEMLTFVQDERGRLAAERGRFDDRVMSFAIAKFVRLKLPLPSSYSSLSGQGHRKATGWT